MMTKHYMWSHPIWAQLFCSLNRKKAFGDSYILSQDVHVKLDWDMKIKVRNF